MTEREYIQEIRRDAAEYRDAIRSVVQSDEQWDSPEFLEKVNQWQAIKQKLSVSTVIDLCDIWLKTKQETLVK